MHYFPFLVFFSSFYSTPNCPHVYTHTLHSQTKIKMHSFINFTKSIYQIRNYDEILFVVLDLTKNIIILPFMCTGDSLFIFLLYECDRRG